MSHYGLHEFSPKNMKEAQTEIELLRAQVAALTQERDKWFANLNVVMKALRDEEPLTEYERKYANAAVASNLILGQRRFKEQADKAEDTLASLRALLPEIEESITNDTVHTLDDALMDDDFFGCECEDCGRLRTAVLKKLARQVRNTLTEKDGVET